MGLAANGELALDDPNRIKWCEQNEAEQGLILQRLQLSIDSIGSLVVHRQDFD